MKEIWKDVVGYEGYYQVSNFGNVKSLDRFIFNKGKSMHLKERLLKLKGGDKYIQVILCKNGITKGKTVHRLVAEAFIPNPDNLPCINHKDHNTKNNNVNNLEWCTYKYNNEYDDRVDKCRSKISATLKGRTPNWEWTEESRKKLSNSIKKHWIKRKQKEEI